mmetsp:Transcript_25324/g.68560  ORF Transcript_25324/g.68560 Transcript_25324/m.68560 type:complete len:97 (+) Transcript_25324:318-608(+)
MTQAAAEAAQARLCACAVPIGKPSAVAPPARCVSVSLPPRPPETPPPTAYAAITRRLRGGNLQLAILDGLLQLAGVIALHSASHANTCAEDLHHSS